MKTYRILSIDGGGIKGLLPAIWLSALEDRIGPLTDHFDLFAGTSSGSFIACALAAGNTTKDIISMFEDEASTIFQPFIYRFWRLFTLRSKHSPKGVEKILKKYLGDMTMGDLKVPTFVMSYDLANGRPRSFYSSAEPEHKVWQVCRASSAAPLYFPPYVMGDSALIDGAMVSNNPTAHTIGLYLQNREDRTQRPLIVSMGTGSPDYDHTPEEVAEWGTLDWLNNITRIVFDGTSDGTDQIVEEHPKIEYYYRFQTILKTAANSIDDVSCCNLTNLKTEAEQYLKNQGNAMIDEIALRLNDV